MSMDTQQLTLVQAAMQGDEQSFSRLYNLYYAKVYALALQTVKNDADAEDVLQSTFIKAWQSLSGLSQPAAFNTWIQRITLNQCTDLLRRRKPQLSIDNERDDEDTVPLELESELMLPEVYAEQEDLSQRLRRLILGLSDVQRQTITLFYYQGLSIPEIAEVMECNENTVKSRLYLARKSLKTEIEEEERKSGSKFYGIPLLPFGKIFVDQMQKTILSPERAAVLYGNIQGAIAAGAGVAGAGAAGMSVVTKVLIGAIAAIVVAAAVIGGITIFNVLQPKEEPTIPSVPTTIAATTQSTAATVASSVQPSTAAPTQPQPNTAAAYRSFLETLQNNQASIEAFNWDNGTHNHENKSIAFVDLNGDGLPEMVYVYADTYRQNPYNTDNQGKAKLAVVTFDGQQAKTVYTSEDPNGWYQNEAGGEMSYAVFTRNNDNALYYYTKGANEAGTRKFAKITLDSSGNAAEEVLSTMDGRNSFTEQENELLNQIDSVLARTTVVTFIDNLPSASGMTYSQAIAYLNSQSGNGSEAVNTLEEAADRDIFAEIAGKSFLSKGGGYGAAGLKPNADGSFSYVHKTGNTSSLNDTGNFTDLEKSSDICYRCTIQDTGTGIDGKTARIYTPDTSLDDMPEADAQSLINHLFVGFGNREKAEEKLSNPIGYYIIVIDNYGIAFIQQ